MLNREQICISCSNKARWVIDNGPTPEFVCARHLSSRLRDLERVLDWGASTIRTMRDYFTRFCLDCGRDCCSMNELYMVWDHVWFSVVKNNHGMLCVICIEKRLGRKLNPADFTHCPLNATPRNKSYRLNQRLGHYIEHEPF